MCISKKGEETLKLIFIREIASYIYLIPFMRWHAMFKRKKIFKPTKGKKKKTLTRDLENDSEVIYQVRNERQFKTFRRECRLGRA